MAATLPKGAIPTAIEPFKVGKCVVWGRIPDFLNFDNLDVAILISAKASAEEENQCDNAVRKVVFQKSDLCSRELLQRWFIRASSLAVNPGSGWLGRVDSKRRQSARLW